MSFERASAVDLVDQEPQNSTWSAEIPPGWRQGAGAYGGLGCAVVLRAMAAAVGEARLPRTLSAQFCAPIPEGRCTVAVTLERRGSAMAFASARLLSEERVVLHAVGTFGPPRDRALDVPLPRLPDSVPGPESFETTEAPSPPFPQFLEQLELRLALGALPFGGIGEERLGAWIRPRQPVPLDCALAVGLLDAMPPVALTRAGRPLGMASVALHAQFLAALPDPAFDPEQHAFVQVESEATADGYSDQHARLYGPDRRLVAVVHQLFAVL